MIDNRYRSAAEILQRGRTQLLDEITDEILDRGEDLVEGGYQLHEFLENQGTRLHFLSLLMGQLESSAEILEEEQAIAEQERLEAEKRQRKQNSPAKKPRAPRARKESTRQTTSRASRKSDES